MDVAILTGAGDDAFCAGADLKEYIPPIVAGGTPDDLRQIAELGLNGFTRGMHRIPKPIVGAVNGWALAGGFETALACDIRIASDRAMFGSFERAAFHHGDGGLVRLVNSGGVGVAMHMLLTAEPIDARQALEWNLVSKVVPHESLMEEAETVARQILRNSQRAGALGCRRSWTWSASRWTNSSAPRPGTPTCADPRRPRRCWSASTRRPTLDGQGPTRPSSDGRRPEATPGPGHRRGGGIGAAIAERLRGDGMEVTTLDRAEGCDLTVDLVADELPDLAEIDVCVSNAAIVDTIAHPPHDPRAVDPRHRRQPDRRIPRRPGLPTRDARTRLGADRRHLLRSRKGRPAGPGRLLRLEGGLAGHGQDARRRERPPRHHRQRPAPRHGRDREGAGDAGRGAGAAADAAAALGPHGRAGRDRRHGQLPVRG